MITVHTAAVLLPGPGERPVPEGAVVVEDDRIAAVGPYAEVVERYPAARVRRWPGLLAPGLVHRGAVSLLEAAYHPDPREADTLGAEPVRDPGALDELGMTEARWGESARRGLQRMLRHGVTAVAGPYGRPAVVTAVARAGVLVVPPAPDVAGPASLDPLAGEAPQACFAGTLVPGARADFAVFDVPAQEPLAALAERGAGSCVATVLAGRLLYRRR